MLGGFKLQYLVYKAASASECPAAPWRFHNAAVFGRLDAFMQRCANMLELQSTCVQFGRLERLEIGGTKGKALTSAIKQVHADFLAAHGRFQQASCCAVINASALGRPAACTGGGVWGRWAVVVVDSKHDRPATCKQPATEGQVSGVIIITMLPFFKTLAHRASFPHACRSRTT